MVRYDNAVLSVAVQTKRKNAEGTVVRSFDFSEPLFSGRADVQPANLTKVEMELYGITEKNSGIQKAFFSTGEDIPPNARARVDFDGGKSKIFTVCPISHWRNHREALLIPVENEGGT